MKMLLLLTTIAAFVAKGTWGGDVQLNPDIPPVSGNDDDDGGGTVPPLFHDPDLVFFEHRFLQNGDQPAEGEEDDGGTDVQPGPGRQNVFDREAKRAERKAIQLCKRECSEDKRLCMVPCKQRTESWHKRPCTRACSSTKRACRKGCRELQMGVQSEEIV
mmetsp:Transcript_45749/g.139006  ORF Transcript_45749/g.139006 Transcript_45749/m.139006 type:complete len:160 (-) Transcript_45749:733-1212(-)